MIQVPASSDVGLREPTAMRVLRSRAARPLRRLAAGVARRWPWPIPVRLSTGDRLYVDLTSAIGRGILVRGEFDPAVWTAASRLLRPGDVFIDVGANIGYYSLLAARRVGPHGEVHAFEVDLRSLRCLWRSQSENALHQLVIHAAALGETNSVVGLHQSAELGHTHLAMEAEGQRYPVMCLDSWLDYFAARPPRLIKIDVEGAERAVLLGGARLLARYRPAVLCETVTRLQSRFDGPPGTLIDLMTGLGYKATPVADAYDDTTLFVPSEWQHVK